MKKELQYSLIIAITYLVFSTLWILYSDRALAAMVTNTEQFREYETLKGLSFAFVSASFIFSLVLLYYKRYKRFQEKYFEIHQEDDRIFRELPIGIAILDLKGHFLKVNRSLSEILGYSSSELLQMNRSEICFRELGELDQDFLKAILKDPDKAFHINKRLKTKNGQAVWCHLSCILMHNLSHEAKYFIINIQDVDRELRMQNRVIKLNHDLLEAQRLGRFGHWSYHFGSHQAKLSEQAMEILNLDTENPEPDEIMSLFDPATRQTIAERVDKLTAEGGRLHSLSSLSRATGVPKYIEIEAELLMGPETNSLLLKGTIKDVTEVMKLQLERENFNKYLVNWAFKLSHELRQPVSSIMGLTQLMKEKLVKEGEQEKYTGYLAQAAAELDDQTRDLAAQFQRMQDLLHVGGADIAVVAKINEVESLKAQTLL